MRSLLCLLLMCLLGCASARLSPEGQRIRLVSTTPQGCKYLGEVTGDENGQSIESGVRWSQEGREAHERARIDLKNMAARMGANTVDLVGDKDEYSGRISGEAYHCP